MATTVGSAEYEISADDAKLIKTMKDVKAANSSAGDSFDKLDKQVDRSAKKMTKSAAAVNKGISGIGRGAGQAGIQMQQFIGQIQGGQNAMLALSQQSADLGFVLGAPLVGAVVGISASLIGILAPSLLKSSDATKDLDEKLKGLIKTTTLTVEQAAVLIATEEKANKEREKTTKELDKTIASKRLAIEASDKNIAVMGKEGEFYESLSKGNKKLREDLNRQVAARQLLTAETKKSAAAIDLYSSITGDKAVTASKEEKDAVDSLISSLLVESNALGLTAKQQVMMTAAGLGATEQDLEQIDSIYSKVEAFKAEQKAAKDKAASDKKIAAEEEAARNKAVSFATGVSNTGLSETDRLALQNENLLALKAKYNEDAAVFDAALTENERQQSNLRIEQSDKEAQDKIKAQDAMNNAVLSSISGFTTSLMSNMDEQSGAYKALFAIQQASAVAQAIVAAEQAAALTLAATASLGPVASVAASNIVRGLGYASAGVIAGTAIAGRENGGSVNSGQMYQMGEGNKPEILQAGNALAVVPGDNGRVFNQNQLDQIDSGGGGFNIQIINEPGVVSMVVSQTDKEAIIKSAVNQAENNYVSQASSKQGKMHKANTQNYGQGNTTGRHM